MKPVYDYVFSLGQWCATALYLRQLGLRSFSGPFDWLGPREEFPLYVDLIESGFQGFLRKENLRKLREDPDEGTVFYVDSATGLETHHEFKIGVPFDEMYERYWATLRRRIDRFQEALRSEKSVLFVHYHGEGRYDRAQIVSGMRRLRAHFPDAHLDLLVLETDRFAAGLREEKPESGIRFVTGDFYDRSRYDAVMGNEPLCRKVFGSIRLRGRWRNRLHLRLASLKRRLQRVKRRCR